MPSTEALSRAAPTADAQFSVAGTEALRFDGFTILPAERRLLCGGQPAKIGARAFDLLLALATARDRVVSKAELLDRVWPALVVEENNLSVHVSQLRKLCGAQVVATVPGRGYQFTAPSVDNKPPAQRCHVESSADGWSADGISQPDRRGNLPADLQPLIGREFDVGEVCRMLESERWVTITGAGGMGKTRLAEAVGHRCSGFDQVWIVELAAVSHPRFVPNAVAQALGITITDTDHPIEEIVAALFDIETVLILDNCEHLIPVVATMCHALLRELPLLRLLVTSQELLHGVEEAVYKLGSLSLPALSQVAQAPQTGSIQLLVARVRALLRNFELTDENIGDAIVICEQLDGLPLAIELAAGRVPMLGLAGVRARLHELFRLLTGDARVRLRRHQTLRAALDWSYQLLVPTEQALLRRLGAFAGSFGIEGVRQIADDQNGNEWAVLDILASLIDKSLVQVRGLGRPRYLMLETTRAYALEQLAVCDESREAFDRHARATSRVCAMAVRGRDTQVVWDEVANIRAAFSWAMRSGETEIAVALVNDSSVVLALGGLVGEVVQRLVEVEPRITDSLPCVLAAQYWQWLGRFGHDGRLPARRCVAALQTAEALFRELANHRHVHACLRMRAEALLEQGKFDEAKQAIQCAHQLETDASPSADRMRRLRTEAKILEGRGEFDRAVALLEQALEMARLADVHRYVASLTQEIGHCHLHAGDATSAESRFRAVLDDPRRDLSVALTTAFARIGLAAALLQQKHVEAARTMALEALPQLRSCGILLGNSEIFSWLLAALGQFHGAAVLLRTSDSFRAYSQTVRGALHNRAYQCAQHLIGEAVGVENHDCSAIVSEAELARLLATALAAPAHGNRTSDC